MRILMILIPGDAAPVAEPALRLARVIPPYYLFRDGGADIVLASPAGGLPWTRREDEDRDLLPALAQRFRIDQGAHDAFADTIGLDQVFAEDFEAAFCVGEIASIWPARDPASAVVAAMLAAGKPVAFIPDTVDLAPAGAGAGLLILGRAQDSPSLAAQALLRIIQSR